MTYWFTDEEFTKNGVTIHVIGTQGLTGKKEDSKVLHMCSAYTEGNADLLLYCIPVSPGHKFHEANHEIMKSLTKAFKQGVWDHCVLVLTMSNHALSSFEEDYPEQDKKVAEEYKEFLKGFSTRFEEKLRDLGVDKHVRTVFELKETDDIAKTIIAIPAGRNAHSRVLPGLEYLLPDHYQEKNWISVLIEIIRTKCTAKSAPLILEYHFGREKYVFNGAMIGMVIGGIIFPVLGAVPGMQVGAVAGCLIDEKKDNKRDGAHQTRSRQPPKQEENRRITE